MTIQQSGTLKTILRPAGTKKFRYDFDNMHLKTILQADQTDLSMEETICLRQNRNEYTLHGYLDPLTGGACVTDLEPDQLTNPCSSTRPFQLAAQL